MNHSAFKNTYFIKKNTLNCRGKIIDLSSPLVMGILNITPDSFYDGGRYDAPDCMESRVSEMLDQGAVFIDVGAVSTRPGGDILTEKEELNRLIPALKLLTKKFPGALFSLDTFRSGVARIAAEEYGICMINDISAGGMDPYMFDTIADLGIPYIMMHIKGTPANMQNNPAYDDLMKEIIDYFSERTEALRSRGVHDVILDPGFGFGKTIDHNYELLSKLEQFRLFGLPLMCGLSRKSMLFRLLSTQPGECLNATTVVNTIALLKGADILRVHDVKEAVEAVRIVEKLEKNGNGKQ